MCGILRRLWGRSGHIGVNTPGPGSNLGRPSRQPRSLKLHCGESRTHKLTLSDQRRCCGRREARQRWLGLAVQQEPDRRTPTRGRQNALSWHRQPRLDDLQLVWSECCGLPSCLWSYTNQVRLLPLDRTGLCLRINWQGASCALLGNLEQLSLFEGRGSRKCAGQHSWL